MINLLADYQYNGFLHEIMDIFCIYSFMIMFRKVHRFGIISLV